MQSINAFTGLSSRVLAAMVALVIPMRAAATSTPKQLETNRLETNGAQLQTTIEEWHWRDMAH